MKLELPLLVAAGAEGAFWLPLIAEGGLGIEDLPALGNLSATVVLAGVLYYVLKHTIPDMRADAAKREAALLEVLGKQRQEQRRDQAAFLHALDKLANKIGIVPPLMMERPADEEGRTK